jgi:hypothetical protein
MMAGCFVPEACSVLFEGLLFPGAAEVVVVVPAEAEVEPEVVAEVGAEVGAEAGAEAGVAQPAVVQSEVVVAVLQVYSG